MGFGVVTIAEKVRKFKNEVPSTEVARRLGISRKMVSAYRWRDRYPERVRMSRRLNYRKNYNGQGGTLPWSDVDIAYLVDNIGQKSFGEIAYALNRSRSSIAGKVNRLGLKK